jgi:RHS repeat-associated protein
VTETGLGTRSVSYDAAANETAVGTSAFGYSTRNNLAAADGLTYTYDGRGLRTVVQDGSGNKRYFFYSPEMSLLAETSLSPTPTTAGGYEYIWFNGHPVAEKNSGTHWTFTDHLGTPLIRTDSAGVVFWRAEHEPYGSVFALRTADQHQPLRLPGQEAEQLNLGANGVTERSYNIFRWYRPTWGRYTQTDPLKLTGGLNLFQYAESDPVDLIDPDGLAPLDRTGFFAIPPGTQELTCFFCTIFAEARGAPAPCQWAVASVIVNRLGDDRARGVPTSICDVVSKPNQFNGYGDANYRHCRDCNFPPRDRPDVDRFNQNFQDGFPQAPDARFFGQNRRGRGFIRVPFAPCSPFLFYNEDPSARRRRIY